MDFYRGAAATVTHELCHEKMCHNIFVVVIPKEGFVDGAPPILLWYDTVYKIALFCFQG